MSTARPRGDYVQGYICLPCTSEIVRTPCPTCCVRIGSEVYQRCIYVFPTQGSTTFAAVNISDGVVSGRHWAVIRFPFDNIYT